MREEILRLERGEIYRRVVASWSARILVVAADLIEHRRGAHQPRFAAILYGELHQPAVVVFSPQAAGAVFAVLVYRIELNVESLQAVGKRFVIAHYAMQRF